jgi:hypothetical protein
MITVETLKLQAKRLRNHIASKNLKISHSDSLEAIAAIHEYKDWNTASAMLRTTGLPINGANIDPVKGETYPRRTTVKNSLSILDRSFTSQKAATEFFYQMRDANIASGGDIANGADFDILRELYLKYCKYTNWEMPGDPIAFYARNIARGSGAQGGLLKGLWLNLAMVQRKNFLPRRPLKLLWINSENDGTLRNSR